MRPATDPAARPSVKARLIVNPVARLRGTLDLDRVRDRLRERGWTVDVVQTGAAGEAMGLAREAAEAGCSVVVACGGDGTINEVVNGLAHGAAALGVIPLGTANVFAAEMGIPRNPIEAADALASGRVRRVDLGLAGDRHFLLMVGIGLDAEVLRTMRPVLKKHFGVAAFVVNGVLKTLGFKAERAIVLVDGVRHRRWLRLAVVGNTRLYGGLFTMTHEARIDDGLLDIVVFSSRTGLIGTTRQFVRLLLRRPNAKAGYDYFRGQEVRIWTNRPLGVQVDGELIGETPMSFRVEPGALNVLLPHPVPDGPFSPRDLADPTDRSPAPAFTPAEAPIKPATSISRSEDRLC